MNEINEPAQAFAYVTLTVEILQKYCHIFELQKTLRPCFFKIL